MAKFVRTAGSLTYVIQHVFGCVNTELEVLFQKSLDSYRIDLPPVEINDPIQMKLLDTKMYVPYMYHMSSIQAIIMALYDMRGYDPQANYTMLALDAKENWSCTKTYQR